MHIPTSTVVALLAPGILVSALPIFKNKGTIDGWDGTNHEHWGSVNQVTNEFYKTGSSLKMIQKYDPNYHNRYHSEVYKKNVYTVGDEGYYGFAFKLDKNWDTSSGQTYNIAQFIADFSDHPDNSCKDTWLPSMMMWIENDQLRIRRKGGDMCHSSQDQFNIGTVKPGTWHRVVLQAKWSSTSSGYYKVWFDGEEALERSNIITTFNDKQKKFSFQFRAGLYANSWHDDKHMEGNQGTRQLWIDEVGIGNTYEDADPGEK